MKVNNLYPVSVFEFDLKLDMDVVREIDKLDLVYRGGTGVQNSELNLHKHHRFDELAINFYACLRQVYQHYNHDCKGYKITAMWANKYEPGTAQEPHRHANSYWSGNFYATEGTPTLFFDPIHDRSQGSLELFTLPKITMTGINQNAPIQELIQAVPNKLIIFPSWFWHCTIPADDDRYTVSFNALPYGPINGGIANIDVS